MSAAIRTWTLRLSLASLFVVGTRALPAARAADDLRWIPSERWLDSARAYSRVSESRPWGELPVQARRIEAGAKLHAGARVDVAMGAWSAGTVRGSSLELDGGWQRGRVVCWLGARLDQRRIGQRERPSGLDPRARLRLGRGDHALVLRWDPGAAPRAADAWSVGAHTALRGARLALEREPDRYGTGAVWHRALGIEVATALGLALAWSADDLRALAEVRAARWKVRVSTVIDGPRSGARAVEIGWSR